MFIKNIHVSLCSINLCLENGPEKKVYLKTYLSNTPNTVDQIQIQIQIHGLKFDQIQIQIQIRRICICILLSTLTQWPVTYLITLSDWIMSCQPGRHAVVTVCEPDWKHKLAAYKSFDETSSFNNL